MTTPRAELSVNEFLFQGACIVAILFSEILRDQDHAVKSDSGRTIIVLRRSSFKYPCNASKRGRRIPLCRLSEQYMDWTDA